MSDKIRVLYGDDEEQNLQSFYANYRRDFYIKTAISAEVAREILEDDWFHVIIADQRMPHETGVEFLSKYLTVNPKPIRILMTAQADIKTVIAAINDGKVFKYIGKPASNEFIEFAIKEAYQLYIAQDNLEKKNKELEKTNRELDKFIYSASHDLRAPLLSILGLVNLGKQDIPNSPKYLDLIERSTVKLDSFILNLINYYKNAKLEVSPIDFDLVKLAEESFENVLYFDGASDIKFNVNSHSKDRIFVTDKTKLGIVFNNIVTNCIRYRDKNKAENAVDIDLYISPEHAKIVISDNGIGIKKENLEKIYTMFYKVSKHSQGSGIGMYIVKDAIEKLNGNIEIVSEENVGTQFILNIPAMEIAKN